MFTGSLFCRKPQLSTVRFRPYTSFTDLTALSKSQYVCTCFTASRRHCRSFCLSASVTPSMIPAEVHSNSYIINNYKDFSSKLLTGIYISSMSDWNCIYHTMAYHPAQSLDDKHLTWINWPECLGRKEYIDWIIRNQNTELICDIISTGHTCGWIQQTANMDQSQWPITSEWLVIPEDLHCTLIHAFF